MDGSKKKILAINFGGIGDEIFFLPTLITLKKEYPNSKITLCLEPRSAGIRDLTNVIDDIIEVNPKSGNKYFEMMKLVIKAIFGRYDMVISSGSSKLISIMLFLTGIKVRCGYDTGNLSRKLLTHAVALNKNQYACKMYHDLIKDITKQTTELPQINIEKKDTVENTVLIHPGVSKLSVKKGCIKTIPPEKWAKVIDKLVSKGKKVILTGGADDKECIEKILENVRTQDFENLYGTTKNLKELAQLISSAEKFLCSDSAPLHIAAALGVKTYVIFGPTNDKTLIPEGRNIVAIKSYDQCPIKPCLWEKRQTTCEKLDCLDIPVTKIAEIVCNE